VAQTFPAPQHTHQGALVYMDNKPYTRQIARHLTNKDNQATFTAPYITELAQDRNGWNSWSAVPKVPDK